RAIAARAERLDPEIATTAFVKEERGGKVFVDSTRVGGATVIAAYSPRVRPGVPVSFPVDWDELDAVAPADFTVHTALRLLGDRVAEHPDGHDLHDRSADVEHDELPDPHLRRAREQADPLVRNDRDGHVTTTREGAAPRRAVSARTRRRSRRGSW